MRKEVIIVILIIAIIFTVNAISQSFTIESVQRITKDLEELESIAKENEDGENKEEISKIIEKVKSDWSNINYIMSYYIEHDEMEKVNSSMVKFETAFNLDEYNEGIIELENCKYILKHIKEKESIRIINFF